MIIKVTQTNLENIENQEKIISYNPTIQIELLIFGGFSFTFSYFHIFLLYTNNRVKKYLLVYFKK